jgi:hypothetical protein
MDKNQREAMSRRQAVGLVGLGLTAAAAQPGLSQANSASSSEVNMQDPRTRYPKPPFKAQTQP